MKNKLVLPKRYEVLTEDEMMYLEGGRAIRETAGRIRNRLDTAIGASRVGSLTATVAFKKTLGASSLVSPLFRAIVDHSTVARSQVQNIINRHGTGRMVTMTSRWAGPMMTGITISL